MEYAIYYAIAILDQEKTKEPLKCSRSVHFNTRGDVFFFSFLCTFCRNVSTRVCTSVRSDWQTNTRWKKRREKSWPENVALFLLFKRKYSYPINRSSIILFSICNSLFLSPFLNGIWFLRVKLHQGNFNYCPNNRKRLCMQKNITTLWFCQSRFCNLLRFSERFCQRFRRFVKEKGFFLCFFFFLTLFYVFKSTRFFRQSKQCVNVSKNIINNSNRISRYTRTAGNTMYTETELPNYDAMERETILTYTVI